MIDDEIIGFFLDEATDYMSFWEKHSLELKQNGQPSELDALFRVAHNLKGSSRTLGLSEFGNAVHKVEDLIVAVRDNQVSLSPEICSFILNCYTFFSDWLEMMREDASYNPGYESIEAKVAAFLSGESAQASEPIAEPSAATEETEATQATEEKPSPLVLDVQEAQPQPKVEAAKSKPKKRKAAGSIRVRSDKLDRLIQLIGELSISQSIASELIKAENVGNDTLRSLRQTTKLAKEIQNEALSLRLSELGPLFQRLERTAYEISESLGKEIQFNIDGETCELDKQAIEVITDPLIHIVRNAVDHGIESTEQREESQKPKKAQVFLGAKSDSDGVAITVRDDGKGLDSEKILNKAIESGLAQSDREYSEEEIYSFLFKSGFSTAEQITDISGRGVGLDVVRQSIENVGGRIKVDSKLGQGSEFTFFVPLNINIIDAVIAEIGEERVVLPLSEITETISMTENEAEVTHESKMFCRRGEVIPVVSSSQTLNINSDSRNEKTAIVVRQNGHSMAFTVNRILGQQSVIIKDIHGNDDHSSFISGATVLGDGKPGLILKLQKIANTLAQNTNFQGNAA